MQRATPIVLNLIIINVLVWLAQNFVTAIDITEWGALHYFKSDAFMPHQFITSMFIHSTDGPAHILFNMLGLWMFGSILENFWGSKRFLIFYLLCGLGGGILTQLTIPYDADMLIKSAEKTLPATAEAQQALIHLKQMFIQQYSAYGASGAIMGILAAFAYLFPNTEMYVMFIPIPVKAKYVVPVFILIDLFGGLHRIEGDNIGHFAHLGGALVGLIIVYFWNKTNRKTFY